MSRYTTYHHTTNEMPTWVAILIFVVLPIVSTIIWFIYYSSTKFTKIVKVADKFMKTQQVGDLRVSSNHIRQTTSISNTRRMVEEYFLVDTDRNLYNVNDCFLCGLHIGSFGKYARVIPGDTIEIQGYGGYFSGIADIYAIRRIN